ncbi:hypothetical protein [Aminobacter anthyllidis]|nr:hypothetical protein [Aminobacter anthyllidis]
MALLGAGKPPVAAGGASPTFNKTAGPAWQNIANGSSVATFSATAIGTADAGRYVVVGVGLHAAATKVVTGITVGGVALTKAIESTDASYKSSLWYGNVPTGTTADIVVTVTAAFAISYIGIVVAEMTLPTPTPTATAMRADSYTGSAGSVSLTVPSSGIGVIVAMVTKGVGTADVGTWTNATEDYETISTVYALGFAHTTTTGALTISVAGDGDNNINMASAAWGP